MKLGLPVIINKLLGARRVRTASPDSDTRFLQYTVLCCAALVTMLSFGIYNLFLSNYLISFVLLCSLTGLIWGWYLLYHGRGEENVYRANSLIFLILLLYLLVIGGESNSMALWMYIGPLTVFFLLGRKEGAYWVGLTWFVLVLIFFWPLNWEGRHEYSFAFSLRFIFTFTIISVITFFYENFRYLYRVDIEQKNRTLQREVEDRKRAERFLRESEERYRTIYLQAAEGILLIDFRGFVVECNPQILQLLGYRENDLIGHNIFSFMNQDDLKTSPPQLDKLKAGEVIFIERRLRSVSGTYILFEQSGKKIGDDLIILLYRDITERKIAEIALERANQALDKLAHVDGLTHIANRRKFDQALETEWKRMRRDNTTLGVILGDIDFFKQFNDIYGHQAGDDCLKNVAMALEGIVHRPADLVSRYGGEEFVVLLPDTGVEGSVRIAEKMRHGIEMLKIVHGGSGVQSVVTMSFGVSVGSDHEFGSPSEFVAAADEALYKAKKQGRNCVVLTS